jgi:hypothetical protein
VRAVWRGVGLLLLGAAAVHAHEVLDADRVQTLLSEVASHHRAAREGAREPDGAESLFRLGESVEALIELINQDLAAHGGSALLASLVAQRLEASGLGVARSPRTGRYAYDLAAFRAYLAHAPAGRWAPAARFRLIAARFHDAPPPDAGPATPGDIAALREAVREQERFLRDYPRHERALLVRFYLGVDAYRVVRAAPDAATARAYARRARRALEAVAGAAPESAEARAARVLLERLE